MSIGGLRVAILNWRDPWHPDAGGAERYAWELATRFSAKGARITFVAARAPGQARRDRIGDVEIIRMGGRFTLYPLALAWLARRRRRFDVVIDCQNGIPFFAPLVHPRAVLVMHHVHDRQFDLHFPGWMARIGRLLEGPVARRVYHRHACVAVSPSTVRAMRERLGWTGPIFVVPNGISVDREHPDVQRTERPSIVCVGRLVTHKRLELVLAVAERLPSVDVHIVGRGTEFVRLRATAPPNVRFHGYLPQKEKERLVARSWLQINASHGEGWGLCVLEAAALGVPSVACDVDGLRDAIRDGRTGWLAAGAGDLADVTERALKELAGNDGYAERCRDWAAGFRWDKTADRFARLLKEKPPFHQTNAQAVRYADGTTAVLENAEPPAKEVAEARAATVEELLLGEVR